MMTILLTLLATLLVSAASAGVPPEPFAPLHGCDAAGRAHHGDEDGLLRIYSSYSYI